MPAGMSDAMRRAATEVVRLGVEAGLAAAEAGRPADSPPREAPTPAQEGNHSLPLRNPRNLPEGSNEANRESGAAPPNTFEAVQAAAAVVIRSGIRAGL